jgi:protein-disulfide isomerase
MKKLLLRSGVCLLALVSSSGFAAGEPAFKVFDRVVTMDQVSKEKQGEFYEIEQKKYELIDGMASEAYLRAYWEKKATDAKTSVEAARKAYMDKNVKVSDKEVKDIVEKYKDNPQFSRLGKDEQQRQVREFLRENGMRNAERNLLKQAKKSGDLVVNYPQPKEPVFDIALSDTDHTRFGPGADDIKPMGCDRKSCPITVVEYSEFQCPYCSKAIPAIKRILREYRGKISWTVRDFPLSFHDRAKPAAVAAHCAGDQGKFWNMYQEIFDNQSDLMDEHLRKYAAKAVPDKAKWEECFKNAAGKESIIQSNMESGMRVGVTGTPAFFINGRRLSGAVPYEEYKRIIDEELSRRRKG